MKRDDEHDNILLVESDPSGKFGATWGPSVVYVLEEESNPIPDQASPKAIDFARILIVEDDPSKGLPAEWDALVVNGERSRAIQPQTRRCLKRGSLTATI